MGVGTALIFSLIFPVFLSAASPVAQLPGAEVELKTQDGWKLKCRYQAATHGHKTLLLIHGRGQRKEHWRRLARALAQAGDGYFAADLRGHGESAIGPDGQLTPWRKF